MKTGSLKRLNMSLSLTANRFSLKVFIVAIKKDERLNRNHFSSKKEVSLTIGWEVAKRSKRGIRKAACLNANKK